MTFERSKSCVEYKHLANPEAMVFKMQKTGNHLFLKQQ